MAVDKIKVIAAEINGTELEYHQEVELAAKNTEFNSTGTDFTSDNVQDAVKEAANYFGPLTQEPTGFPNRIDSAISFDDATRTFTIAPVLAPFSYYIAGVKFTKTTPQTAQITDTDGSWYIYFEGETLYASQTVWTFNGHQAPVAVVYWDATSNKQIVLAEERHGLVMDWRTHSYIHANLKTQIQKNTSSDWDLGPYILRGDGSLNSHATIGMTAGYVWDEDIRFLVQHSASPTLEFQQILNNIAFLPVYYLTGTGSGVWRRQDATQFPVIYDGVNPIKYNFFNTATNTWELANCMNNSYMTMWLFVTNNIFNPVCVVLGRENSADVTQLTKKTVFSITDNMPFQEYYTLAKLIFRTSTSYTNTPKASLFVVDEKAQDPTSSNDRYTFTCQYGANAGVGRYLEIFAGVDSSDAPFTFPESSFIRTITVSCSALSTGTIGFFKVTDLVNPVISISLTNQRYARFDFTTYFASDEQVALRVTSGSFAKPALRVWIQTEI